MVSGCLGDGRNNVSAVRLYGGGLSVFPREKTAGRGSRAESRGDCGLCALAQGRDGLAHTPAGHPRGQIGDCPVYSLSVIRSAHWALRALPLCWPEFDLIPLPHPSGASPWPRQEPGKSLLRKALQLIAAHPSMLALATLPGHKISRNLPPHKRGVRSGAVHWERRLGEC